MSTSATNTDDISIKLTHELDDEASYPGAITFVNAAILLQNKQIGTIQAVLVDRQRIAENSFHSVFDEHSSDLEWVGCALMENKFGRTRLKSLQEYDDPEFDFLFISAFHVDHEHKQNRSSDVGADALRKFLFHPFIKGDLDYGCWKVSSAAYVLSFREAMTPEERKEFDESLQRDRDTPGGRVVKSAEDQAKEDRFLEKTARFDANQFLRNGFFQDAAIATAGGESNSRILVASCGTMKEPMKSHADVSSIRLYSPRSRVLGEDAKLQEAVAIGCGKMGNWCPNVAQEFQVLMVEIRARLQAGASILRSHALHAACANNNLDVANYLVLTEPDALDSKDINGSTPLMVAAMSAAGRNSISGIEETRVLDRLLALGADKSITNSSGMTAFGVFKSQIAEYGLMLQAMTGGFVCPSTIAHKSVTAVEDKLRPPAGPTSADLSGAGTGGNTGFMDYSEEDRQRAEEMGEWYESEEADY